MSEWVSKRVEELKSSVLFKVPWRIMVCFGFSPGLSQVGHGHMCVFAYCLL